MRDGLKPRGVDEIGYSLVVDFILSCVFLAWIADIVGIKHPR